MVNDNKALKIAEYAIMFATIFVAMMLDRVISLGLPTSTAACVLLITFSFCFLRGSGGNAVVACTLFGLASFAKEFLFPSSVAGFPVFVWPLITVLPRFVMGVATCLVYKLLVKFVKVQNVKKQQNICMRIAIFVGLCANTVLFLTALNLAKRAYGQESLVTLTKMMVYANIIPEYLISVIFAPVVVFGVRKGLKIGIDGTSQAN